MKLLKISGIILGSLAGLILVAFAIYVYLYYPRRAEPFEINPPNPTSHILIATQSTGFKNTLVTTLCDSLKRSSVHVKGIDVGKLAGVNEAEWDRILIVNSFVIRLNKHVERFVVQSSAPDKILVFVTSGGADWTPPSEFKVDAFTSASRKVSSSALVHLITDWMNHKDGEAWEPKDYLLALAYFPEVDVGAACEAIALHSERYRAIYPNLATVINRAGYQYLRVKNVKSALRVFELNVSLFPDAWNVYDSYGEALLVSGDREAAITNYKKAVELNPESKSANDMLRKLSAN